MRRLAVLVSRLALMTAALAFVSACGGAQQRVRVANGEDRPTGDDEAPASDEGQHVHTDATMDLPADVAVVEPDHPATQTPEQRALVHVHTPKAVCSGAVIGPSLVLTARQCVGTAAGPVAPADADKYRVEVASSTLTWTLRGVKQVVAPSCAWQDLDLAVLVLDKPVEGIAPLAGTSAPGPGADLQALGFGRCAGETRAIGDRRGAVVSRDPEAVVVDLPLCKGDVGGPVLHEGGIVGIVSHQDDPDGSPRHTTTAFRADTTEARALLDSAAAAASSGKPAGPVACDDR